MDVYESFLIEDCKIKDREYTGEWAKAWREAIEPKEEIIITYYYGTDAAEIGSMDCIEIDRETDPMYIERWGAKIICGNIKMKAYSTGSPSFARGCAYNVEIRRNGRTETWIEQLWFPNDLEHEVLPDGMIWIPAGALMRGKAIWRAMKDESVK